MKSCVLALTAIAGCALTPAWAAQPAIAGATPCGFTDLMPPYQAFATRTAELAPEQRATAFRQEIAARYPDYYSPAVFGDDTKLQTRAVRFFDPATRTALFPDRPALTEARLAAMGATIGAQFLEQQTRLMQTFTDFNCRTTVEFGVSLLKFDGHPVDFDGKRHLLFGVDVIATLHDEADMASFFDHEIFHIYHQQVIESQIPQGDAPGWYSMWLEGLATYVSQRMNPRLDAQQVL